MITILVRKLAHSLPLVFGKDVSCYILDDEHGKEASPVGVCKFTGITISSLNVSFVCIGNILRGACMYNIYI